VVSKRKIKLNGLFDTFRLLVSILINKKNQNIPFLEDHPMNIPTKLNSNRLSGFREED
jgi:hypothetical protein